MAALIIAAGFAIAKKVEDKKERKREKKRRDDQRYRELQQETYGDATATTSPSSTRRNGRDSLVEPPPPYENVTREDADAEDSDERLEEDDFEIDGRGGRGEPVRRVTSRASTVPVQTPTSPAPPPYQRTESGRLINF